MYKHAYIVAENGKYVVKSESGKNLGTYSTKEQAEKRLEQVEWFKARSKTSEAAVFEEKTASAILRAYELGCDLAIKVAEDGVATKSDPELWSRAKSEAKSRMGGKHSARAMQLATKIYKERGGDYAGKKPSASQNKMRKWTKQDWQTRPGTSEIAEKSDGRTSRYLPKAKWDSLSKSEQKATDAKKLRSDKQYVDNTDAAKVKGNATYIKKSELEFKPDISAADLKAMGVYDQVYGDTESEASMEKWPAHWLHEQDPLGWLQWYERYSQGRRTEDDARQIKRWASFKARHGSQYTKNPTPRRKAALRNWGIDADKLLKESEARSAVIIKGNPDVIHGEDKQHYDKYYSDIAKLLYDKGVSDIKFDDGLPYTEPSAADLWLGHSRGADRLRFAPSKTKTIRLDDFEDTPVDINKPGKEHYTITNKLKEAINTAMLEKQSKVLTTRGRDRIKEKNFALDNRRYPIHDINHARAALSMVAKHGTTAEQEQVRQAVYAKYPGIANRAKQADYRDRATLLLHNGQGGVLAAKNQHPENPIYPPYFFPGGGVFKEEGIRNSVTEEEIQEGLRREALEEIGHKLKNIDSLGTSAVEVNMGDAWAAKQLAKKGVPYKGFREHIRAAMSDGIDNSILGSEGDDFTAYNPEYINAHELASALESSLPGLRKAGDPTLVTSRLQTIEALKRLGNTKQADYRDRATLILHDGKGNVFAAPELDDPLKMPYHFPGGGIYDEEDINNPLPTHQQVEAGLRREALEELGYNLKNIQDFGYGPNNIDMGPAWRARAMAKRGQPFKGIREHLRAAEIESEDNSLLNSEGDSFHKYYPEYVEANLLAKQIEDHAMSNKHRISSSELANRAGIAKFIRNLAVEKTAEEKRYRPKVQGLLYTPDLRVLAAKSQGAGSGLRQFNNYKFPGGGIEPGESLVEAAKKELLEETGYSTAGDPFEFGMPAITVDWDEAFRQQALKKGRDFHGEISHFLAAPVGARDLSLHGKEGDQLLDADFVPVDDLIADLEHTSSLPENEYAMFDKNKLEAARKFKEHMTKKAYYIGRRLAILAHS